MGFESKIEWTDHTFSPWVGCTKISPACDHCYAEGWAKRSGQVVWGGERKRTSIANWRMPVKWNKQAALMQSAWTHGVDLHGGDESACIAAGFIKPVRPKVFCASLADVFDNEVPVQWRMDLFGLIADTPNLDWLILTKRIGNVMSMCSGDSLMFDMIGQRVWLGATICNQTEADRDIPKLLAVPAAKRFLSMEPLLGPVNPTRVVYPTFVQKDENDPYVAYDTLRGHMIGPDDVGLPKLDWIIVGGESGPNARPMHPDWARNLRDQCEAAGVPFLFKQWGEWIGVQDMRLLTGGNGPGFGAFDHCTYDQDHEAVRVGKKVAGRLLDGREWNGVPA